MKADDEIVAEAEVQELKKRSCELAQVLGRKALENKVLKEAVTVATKKTDFAVAIRGRREYPVKMVAEILKPVRVTG